MAFFCAAVNRGKSHVLWLGFLPFPDAGHGVTEAMWKEAQEWIVRGLGKPGAP